MRKLVLISVIILWGFSATSQEIGLQLYSLRNQFKQDVPGTLDLIQSFGITTLEGGDSYGVPLIEFKGMLEERNFTMVSVQGSYEDLKNNVEKVINSAKAYGAPYVMCAWIDHEEDIFDINNTKEAVEIFNTAGKRLKEEGLELLYHPHGYEFRPYQKGTLFDYMVKNAKHFGFEMDVYWFQHGGADPMEYLNKYPEVFHLMHLKDMRKGVKGDNTGHSDVETNVVLGTGQIAIDELVKRGREIGIKYMFIEDESSNAATQIPKSLSFLKTLN